MWISNDHDCYCRIKWYLMILSIPKWMKNTKLLWTQWKKCGLESVYYVSMLLILVCIRFLCKPSQQRPWPIVPKLWQKGHQWQTWILHRLRLDQQACKLGFRRKQVLLSLQQPRRNVWKQKKSRIKWTNTAMERSYLTNHVVY